MPEKETDVAVKIINGATINGDSKQSSHGDTFPIILIEWDDGFLPFNGRIWVDRQEIGQVIPAEAEELLIAQFNGKNLEKAYNTCVKYKEHYDRVFNFNNAQFYNNNDTKEEKQNKEFFETY